MNSETHTLIERPYQEIVDDILTAIVGGVVNEPIFYDLKEDQYALSQPARDIRSISGTHDSLHHTFQKTVDFLFSEADNAVVWQDGGNRPDDETIFYVDYFRPNGGSPLTDINVGSVTRTLGEAIGREIATVYQQINQAYLSAFLDTAEGKSLDFVVAIFGLKRKTKDFAIGSVTFFRDPAAGDGNIAIPEGTPLRTEKGKATFVTTQLRVLQRGQVRIDVPIRAGDASKGPDGLCKAGEITTLAQAITGIARITNLEPTILGTDDESDDDLRTRARVALRGLSKGTLFSLHQVIRERRATVAETWDPSGPPTKQSPPGSVVLLVESEPERFPDLRADVEQTRAAGVLATLVARYVFFKPRVKVKIKPGLTTEGTNKVLDEILAKLQEYVDGLSAGDPAKGQDLLAAIKKAKDVVGDPKIVDVMAWRSDLAQAGPEVLIDQLLAAITSAPAGDEVALRAALLSTLTESTPTAPTGRRTPDRGLVQGPSGQRAKDEEIEAGTFQVSATVNGESWWVVLDMEREDIQLLES
jgi:hypothetical protein